ncbi:MAG: AAA family ATPase [Desulfurococcales archaeon]|nr:AAA family ATPase [Desulfurococcales archaeon]
MYESRIFRNRKVLDESYIPDSLRVRDAEASMLIGRYLNRFREGLGSTDISLIYGSLGKVGIGKTTLARYVGLALERETRRYGVNFKHVYINTYSAPSLHQILTLIASQLNMGITVRGSAAIEVLKAITDYLYRRDLHILVILDEFQSLLMSPRVDDDHLYLLLRVYEEIPAKDGINRINYLLIGQDFRVVSHMKERIPQVESQIGFRLYLKPYSKRELYDILEQRAEKALEPHAWNEYLLDMIADYYGYDELKGGDGSARKAILTLRMAAEIAEVKGSPSILEEHVRLALSENAVASIPLDDLRGLNTHELLILLSIASSILEGKGLITTGELREKYNEIAEFYGESPRGHTQFHVYLRNLNALGLIDLKPSGKGVKGRTTLIRLSPEIPVDRLREAVESIILDRTSPSRGRRSWI